MKAYSMQQPMRIFLLYGTLFAVATVAVDAIRDRSLADWRLDCLSAYAAAAVVAAISYWFSKRNRS